jgi:anti-anti-sigma factor
LPQGGDPLSKRGLTFVDCAGLGIFLECAERLAERDERLTIHDPPPMLRRLLTITGLDQRFSILPV